jgi:trimeric autotransporter adhesin
MLSLRRKPHVIAGFAALVLLAFAAGCRGFFVNPTVTAVSVSPSTNNLQINGTAQLTAIATFSDGSTQDVTGSAIWQSSDATGTVVSVSKSGLVKGLQATSSTVTITATYKGSAGTASVTVGAVALTITCNSCSSGNVISLSGNGGILSAVTFTSSVAANWSSSNSSVINLTTQNSTSGSGTLGGTTGTVTITATAASGTGSGTLQVTVNP